VNGSHSETSSGGRAVWSRSSTATFTEPTAA
jgi:hypothetical protein